MEINNQTFNECGTLVPLDESVIALLQIKIPKHELAEGEKLNYKNCNSFELLFDKRHPQILYYLGDFCYNDEANPTRFYNAFIFEGTTVGGSNDLMESYRACVAIKQWAENTMELINQKCIFENHTSDWDKVDADILKDMKKLGWNINNKTQDNEI